MRTMTATKAWIYWGVMVQKWPFLLFSLCHKGKGEWKFIESGSK
jgi:hypothetical protein